MFFDVFAEERGVGKSEADTDFLDAQVGGDKEITDVFHHVLGNPCVGGLARIFLADGGKVFWCDAQFIGIRFHGAVLDGGAAQQFDEPLEETVGMVFRRWYGAVVGKQGGFLNTAQGEETTAQQRVDNIGLV